MKKLISVFVLCLAVVCGMWGEEIQDLEIEEPEYVGEPQEYGDRVYGEPGYIYFSGTSRENCSGRSIARETATQNAKMYIVRQIFEKMSGFRTADSYAFTTDDEDALAENYGKYSSYFEGMFAGVVFSDYQVLKCEAKQKPYLSGKGKKMYIGWCLSRAPKSAVSEVLASMDMNDVVDKVMNMLERKEKITLPEEIREREKRYAEQAKEAWAKEAGITIDEYDEE